MQDHLLDPDTGKEDRLVDEVNDMDPGEVLEECLNRGLIKDEEMNVFRDRLIDDRWME
jgi:hypothetical protein